MAVDEELPLIFKRIVSDQAADAPVPKSCEILTVDTPVSEVIEGPVPVLSGLPRICEDSSKLVFEDILQGFLRYYWLHHLVAKGWLLCSFRRLQEGCLIKCKMWSFIIHCQRLSQMRRGSNRTRRTILHILSGWACTSMRTSLGSSGAEAVG